MEFLAHGNADHAWRDQGAYHSCDPDAPRHAVLFGCFSKSIHCERHGPGRYSAQCVATDQSLLENWLRRLSVMNAP